MKLPILLCLLFISSSYATCTDTCDTYMGTCYDNTEVSGCTSDADCCPTTSTACTDTCDTYMGTCYVNTEVSGCTSDADCCPTTSTACTDTCDTYGGTCNDNTDKGCLNDADCCATACTDTCYSGSCAESGSYCSSNDDCCAGCLDYCAQNGHCFISSEACDDDDECCAICDVMERPVADPPIYGAARQSQQDGDENMNMICKKDFDNDNSCTVCPDGKTRCLYDSDCSVCLDADDAGKRYCANSPNTVECTNDYDCFGYTSGYTQNIYFGADASTSIYYGLECSQNICTDGMTICAHDNDCYICQSSGVCGVYADVCDPNDEGLPTCTPLCLDPVDTTGYSNVVTDRRANTGLSDTPFMYWSYDNADFACAEGYSGIPEAECNKGQPLVLSGCDVAEVPFSGPDWADGDDGSVGDAGSHSTQDRFRIVIDGVEKTTGTLGIFEGETIIHRLTDSNLVVNQMLLTNIYSIDTNVDWNVWDTQFKTGEDTDDPNGNKFTLKFWDGTTEITLSPEYEYNNDGNVAFITFTNPTFCTEPSTTGYVFTSATGSLAKASFSRTGISCASGYSGEVTINECTAAEQPYSVSGCVEVTECTTPTTAGYVFTSATGSLAKASFSRTGISCASGYSGEVTINECTEAGQPYSVSGCVEVPTCGTGVATHDCLCNGARRLRRRLSTATCVSGEVCQSDGTCVVHCEGEFGGYGACSDGKKSRQYDVTIPASNGGDDCDHPDDYIDEQDCLGHIGDQCSDNVHCGSEYCDGNSCADLLENGELCWEDGEVQGSCPAGSTCYRKDDAYDVWYDNYADYDCSDSGCLDAISILEECRFNNDYECKCLITGVEMPICTLSEEVVGEKCTCGPRGEDRRCSVGSACQNDNGFFCQVLCSEDSETYGGCYCSVGGFSDSSGEECIRGDICSSGTCIGKCGRGSPMNPNPSQEDADAECTNPSYPTCDMVNNRCAEAEGGRGTGQACTENEQCVSGLCDINSCAEAPGASGSCNPGHELVGDACSKCKVGRHSNGLQACSKWADRYFAGKSKKTSAVDMRALIEEQKANLDIGNRRRNVRDMLKWMKNEIIGLSRKVRLKKDTLSFSAAFSQRLTSRGNDVDVFVPKTKTKITTAQACDEADVDVSSQTVPYEISQDEGETALVCKGSTPITKLLMERDGEVHDEENDVYKYACWNGAGWDADVQVADGGSYTCGTQKFFVNSLSGVTCDATDPVSSADSNVDVGTDNCGTIAEGEVCTDYTCNANFVSQSGPSCTVDGYQPAVCECPVGHVEDGAACQVILAQNGDPCSANEECVSGHCVTNGCVADPNALNWVVAPPDQTAAGNLVTPKFKIYLDGVEQHNPDGKLAMIKDGYVYGLDDDGSFQNALGQTLWAPEEFNTESEGDVFQIHWSPDGIEEYTSATATYTLIIEDQATYTVNYYTTIDMTWDLQTKWNLVSFIVKPANINDALASIDADNLQGCTDTECSNGGEYIILRDGKTVRFYDLGPDIAGGALDKKWYSLTTAMGTFNSAFKDFVEGGTAFKYFTPEARIETITGPQYESIDYDFKPGFNWVGLIGQNEIPYGANEFHDDLFIGNADATVGDSIIHRDGATVEFYDEGDNFGGQLKRKWYSMAGQTFKLKPGEGFYYKRTGSAVQITKTI